MHRLDTYKSRWDYKHTLNKNHSVSRSNEKYNRFFYHNDKGITIKSKNIFQGQEEEKEKCDFTVNVWRGHKW